MRFKYTNCIGSSDAPETLLNKLFYLNTPTVSVQGYYCYDDQAFYFEFKYTNCIGSSYHFIADFYPQLLFKYTNCIGSSFVTDHEKALVEHLNTPTVSVQVNTASKLKLFAFI